MAPFVMLGTMRPVDTACTARRKILSYPVLARISEIWRFTVPSLKYSSVAISLRVFVSHTKRKIASSVSVSCAASEKMLYCAKGKVEYPSTVERMMPKSSVVPTFL